MSSLTDVRVLSARRAYEFRPDDIRLTVLCTHPVIDFVRETFDFRRAAVASPPPLFGEVTEAVPPGLVFSTGSIADADDALTPIRFLHVEPRRIVIDVAAPTEALDPVFERLVAAISGIPVSGGSTVIGEVSRTIDYSGLTAQFPSPLTALLNPRIVELLPAAISSEGEGAFVPTLSFQRVAAGQSYPGGAGPDAGAAQLSLRAGTNPEDCVVLSTAFLDTTAHRDYLEEVARALSGRGKQQRRLTGS